MGIQGVANHFDIRISQYVPVKLFSMETLPLLHIGSPLSPQGGVGDCTLHRIMPHRAALSVGGTTKWEDKRVWCAERGFQGRSSRLLLLILPWFWGHLLMPPTSDKRNDVDKPLSYAPTIQIRLPEACA